MTLNWAFQVGGQDFGDYVLNAGGDFAVESDYVKSIELNSFEKRYIKVIYRECLINRYFSRIKITSHHETEGGGESINKVFREFNDYNHIAVNLGRRPYGNLSGIEDLLVSAYPRWNHALHHAQVQEFISLKMANFFMFDELEPDDDSENILTFFMGSHKSIPGGQIPFMTPEILKIIVDKRREADLRINRLNDEEGAFLETLCRL